MTKRVVSLGGALALLAVVACGGGGDNDSPTQPNARLVMDLRLSTGASGPPTFRGLSLFLDDALLGQVTTPEAVASHQIHVDAGPQPPGRHVIRAVITDQTVSPSTYVLLGSAQYAGRTIPLFSAPTRVETGGSVTAEVDL